MTWWVTLLEWIGAIIVVTIFITGIYTILAIISNKILKRRYKQENDIGRKRQDFGDSLNRSRQTPGIRIQHDDNKRGLLQETQDSPNEQLNRSVGEDGKEAGHDRKESRVYGYDYERFKREVLNKK